MTPVQTETLIRVASDIASAYEPRPGEQSAIDGLFDQGLLIIKLEDGRPARYRLSREGCALFTHADPLTAEYGI